MLGNRFLSARHQYVDELRDIGVAVLGIRQDLALGNLSAAWHGKALNRIYAALGFLAPYFERPCLRSLTPWVSRLPRTMWEGTPGRSFTRAAPIRTTRWSCRLLPSPPMELVTANP